MAEDNVRAVVLEVLTEVLEEGKYSHLIIRQALNKYDYLERSQRSFLKRLSMGCVERKITLDYIINQVSKTPVDKMKPLIRNIMRMGVYQLYYMETPSSAAVNEAVKLAQKRGLGGLKGFVNGVLRNIERNKEELLENMPVWAEYSMPEELFLDFVSWYGEETAEKICSYFIAADTRGVSVRRNTSIISEKEWFEKLERDGISWKKSPYCDSAYELFGVEGLDFNESFQNGDFQAQDISSVLAGEITKDLTDLPEVLDLCAAPGGKSIHQADKMNGKGHITACDISEYKVSMIEENISRCGFGNIDAVVSDASVFDEKKAGKYDLVIADLPCSGLGIIGNKPDIKYQLQSVRMKELAALQKRILANAASYVKPGGVLVYTTCTINPGENIDNFRWFLDEFPTFKAEDFSELLCEEIRESSAKEGYLQIIPGIHESAGFFLSRMRKNSQE